MPGASVTLGATRNDFVPSRLWRDPGVGNIGAKAVAEEAAGIREALRRPVIRRKVTERWDDDRGEWVPETKELEVGIGPVGAFLVGAVALGAVGAAAGAVKSTNERLKAREG